jgi:spore germination protein KB
MNIEKEEISNFQFIFLIVGFIEGSIFLVHFVTNLARHDTWLTVLSGLAVFLPITFAVNDSKALTKTFLSGLFLATALFMVTVIRNTAVLGDTETLLFSPSFQVARLINFGFLSRLDILFAAGHTVAIFLKCSILFYVTGVCLAQILKLRTYRPALFPLGCIAIILGIILYPSPTAHLKASKMFWSLLSAL